MKSVTEFYLASHFYGFETRLFNFFFKVAYFKLPTSLDVNIKSVVWFQL